MRALIVTAAVVLSVTAGHAQEMVPAKPAVVAQGSTDRAIPPAAAVPTSRLIEQLKAAGELKDTRALEAPAPKVDAADAKPVEAKPVEAKPVDAQPVIAKPVDAKPVETTKPAETKAVETKPVEAKPVDSRPAEAAQAAPAKKRVVKKRETDEQKARRIAAKYGVSW
jgi:ribonuclease E